MDWWWVKLREINILLPCLFLFIWLSTWPCLYARILFALFIDFLVSQSVSADILYKLMPSIHDTWFRHQITVFIKLHNCFGYHKVSAVFTLHNGLVTVGHTLNYISLAFPDNVFFAKHMREMWCMIMLLARDWNSSKWKRWHARRLQSRLSVCWFAGKKEETILLSHWL